MRTVLGRMAFLLIVAPAVARGDTLVADFSEPTAPSPWSVDTSSAVMSKGSLGPGAGHVGPGAQLSFSFTCGPEPQRFNCASRFVAARRTLDVPVASAAALSVWLRSPPGVRVSLWVYDGTSQLLQYDVTRPLEAQDPSQWYRQVVALAAPTAHYGGDATTVPGVVTKGVSAVAVVARQPLETLAGVLEFDDVTLLDAADVTLDPAAPPSFAAPTGAADLKARLGVAVRSSAELASLDVIRDVGAGWVRTELSWSEVEYPAGTYVYKHALPHPDYDQFGDAAAAHELRVLAILAFGNPLYAPAGTGFPWAPRDPVAVKAFGDFVSNAVTHMKGRGYAYEIWNEPNLSPPFWTGPASEAEFATLFREALLRVRAAEPVAPVVTGGLSEVHTEYLRRMLDQGVGVPDAIGLHPYEYVYTPERMTDELLYARRIVADSAPVATRPLWNTESGYSSAQIAKEAKDGSDGHSATARSRQAVLGTRMILTEWAVGLPLFVHFEARDSGPSATDPEQNYGLNDSSGQPKPLFNGVRALTKAARDRSYVGSYTAGTTSVHALRLDGTTDTVLVVWNSAPGGAVTVRTPKPTSASDMYGDPLVLQGTGDTRSVELSEPTGPVYLTFPRASEPAGGQGTGGAGGSAAGAGGTVTVGAGGTVTAGAGGTVTAGAGGTVAAGGVDAVGAGGNASGASGGGRGGGGGVAGSGAGARGGMAGSAAGDGSGPGAADDGGCGCRVEAGERSPSGVVAGALAVLGLVRRRRRGGRGGRGSAAE